MGSAPEKNASEALSAGDGLLAEASRQLLLSMSEVALDTDRYTLYSYCDNTVAAGIYSDDLCMRLLHDIHEEDAGAVRSALSLEALSARGASPKSVCYRTRVSDGDWRWVESCAVSICSGDERRAAIITRSLDECERPLTAINSEAAEAFKEAEEARRRGRERTQIKPLQITVSGQRQP
jgi:hypothetical protein